MAVDDGGQLRTPSLELLCEEERLHRLAERMRRDTNESAEPARELRALQVAREARARGLLPKVPLGDSSAGVSEDAERRSSAALELDAMLEARRHTALQQAAADTVAGTSLEPSRDCMTMPPSSLNASCTPEAPAPSDAAQPVGLAGRLATALDVLTTHRLSEFRDLAAPTAPIVAVVLAMLALVAPASQGIPRTWGEAIVALERPGVLVSAMRRFPYIAERGGIEEDRLVEAEEQLAEAMPLPLMPVAAALREWARAATEFAAWCHARAAAETPPAIRQEASRPEAEARQPDARNPDARQPEARRTRGETPRSVVSTPPARPRDTAATQMRTTTTPARKQPRSPRQAPAMATTPRQGCGGRPSSPQSRSPGYVTPTPRRAPDSGYPSVGASPRSPARTPRAPVAGSAVASAAAASQRKAPTPGRRQMATPSRQSAQGGHSTATPSPTASAQSTLSATGARGEAQKRVEAMEFQQHLGRARKEMLEIKGLEGQMRWGMQREEKKHVQKEQIEDERDILAWRNDQRIRMQAYVQEIYQQRRAEELQDKQDLNDFRRDAKEAEMQEELQRIAEEYLTNAEYAQWQEDIGKITEEQDRDILDFRAQYRIEVRDIVANERLFEKIRCDEDRTIERSLEMTHQVNQMSREKEEMLRNLQMMQSRQKALPSSRPRARRAGGL